MRTFFMLTVLGAMVAWCNFAPQTSASPTEDGVVVVAGDDEAFGAFGDGKEGDKGKGKGKGGHGKGKGKGKDDGGKGKGKGKGKDDAEV